MFIRSRVIESYGEQVINIVFYFYINKLSDHLKLARVEMFCYKLRDIYLKINVIIQRYVVIILDIRGCRLHKYKCYNTILILKIIQWFTDMRILRNNMEYLFLCSIHGYIL